jgi:tRNA pseudouridine55 synthase
MTLCGLLNLNKPTGVTSRWVVDQVKRLVKPAKVGHAGTLDPLASGVLVIGVGQGTRLVEYVQRHSKRYRATFLLGRTSTTEDVEGDVTLIEGAAVPTREAIEQAARQLVGQIEQRPPAFSALKVEGRRAYALARAGQPVELAARSVHVQSIELVRYDYPELCMDVECGSGTYVRSLGRDLAERLGSGAVMSALERTAIGPFRLEDALDPASLTQENLAGSLLPLVAGTRGLVPEQVVTEADVAHLSQGRSIDLPAGTAAECAALDEGGHLVAIIERRADGRFGPAKYFPAS